MPPEGIVSKRQIRLRPGGRSKVALLPAGTCNDSLLEMAPPWAACVRKVRTSRSAAPATVREALKLSGGRFLMLERDDDGLG